MSLLPAVFRSALSDRSRRVWIVLVLATGVSFAIGESGGGDALGLLAVSGLMLLAVVKGWLVIDEFMGLRDAPPLWRWLMLGWLLLVCAGILLAYAFGAMK